MEKLKYLFYISIVWSLILAIIVFAFTKKLEIKDLRIHGSDFVIGELSKNVCK